MARTWAQGSGTARVVRVIQGVARRQWMAGYEVRVSKMKRGVWVPCGVGFFERVWMARTCGGPRELRVLCSAGKRPILTSQPTTPTKRKEPIAWVQGSGIMLYGAEELWADSGSLILSKGFRGGGETGTWEVNDGYDLVSC